METSAGSARSSRVLVAMLAVAGALGAVVLRAATEASKAEEAHAGEEYVIPARPELPFYSADDVARHTTRDSRIWVTYQTGVYVHSGLRAGARRRQLLTSV